MKILKPVLKWLPAIVLIILFMVIILSNYQRYFSLDFLKAHLQSIQHYAHHHIFLAPMIFIAIYALLNFFPIPVLWLLCLVAGYLFGVFLGTLYIACGELLPGAIIFQYVKTLSGDRVIKKRGGLYHHVIKKIKENAFLYIIILRCLSVVAFVINVACGMLRLRLRAYLIANFIGCIPVSIIYATIGKSLTSIVFSTEPFRVMAFLKPELIIPIVVLLVFILAGAFFSKRLFKG